MKKDYKIAVAGTGYVGLSIATLLSQHHQVTAVDIIPEKVDMINNRKSPIQDDYIEKQETLLQRNFTVYVPKVDEHFVGSLAVVPLQLMGYYVSVAKGLDVDKPRNLAKSVTVE